MIPADTARIEQFITRWQTSSGNERANYQMFFAELCDALGVDRPNVNGGVAVAPYCFDKHLTIYHPSGKKTPGYIDFYKADHFLIEAKQGSDRSGKGTAKRGTNTYLKAMEAAFVQAIAYTRNLHSKPPFVLTCDIGHHFELWTGFNGEYGGYGARQDIALTDLRQPEIFDLFVDIFSDPQKRNPEKIAARVTREVAADLAELSKKLEKSPHPQSFSLGATGVDSVSLFLGENELGDEGRPQQVAHFLMRCIFTMFAEDVGLLKEHLFTEALETRWLPNPKMFKPEVEALWQAMNDGTAFGFYGRLLKFNGGLFAEATAFELTSDQLEVLLRAAKREWKEVEPAIFGTLLERALDTKERSKLGAHYTPRSYVERLVRPVVMEPLREQWDLVQGEVLQLLGNADTEPTAAQKKKAVVALEAFLTELRQVRILDPACGSGNFLYVTLDLIKQLESEVLRRLEDITGRAQLRLDIDQVNPSQFLGIELNPRAAAIADLVIWIGYLQWHFRRFGDIPPVEPVLREYKNIECRDAVLAYDGKEPDVDPKTGKVRSRWGGRMMKHPVTGEEVPDPSDQIVIYRYIGARSAVWPEADYIVSNPPFIGNKRMRGSLSDGYVEALRATHNDVPEPSDYVMYWWNYAAKLEQSKALKRFGFITTNSITQSFNRKVVEANLSEQQPLSLIFAIPDHPWIDSADGAAVRVAMTVGETGITSGKLLGIQKEFYEDDGTAIVEFSELKGVIHPDLTVGADVTSMVPLKANYRMSFQGVIPLGDGFRLDKNELISLDLDPNNLPSVIKPYMIGRDLVQQHQQRWVIDFFGLTVTEARLQYPNLYQRILETVKPVRDQNNRKSRRENWWLFGENAPKLRTAITEVKRFIVTPDTSKFKPFVFVEAELLPDVQLYSVVSDDAWVLGVLESKVHQAWIDKIAPRMGKGNDLRWKPGVVFDPFPFPDPTPDRQQKIRELGDRLDSHRKRVQAQHPEVTITAIYNLLEKIRAGEPLTDKDREFNNKALVSTLKQIHDELDAEVFKAYGWEDSILPSPLAPLPKGEGNNSADWLPSPSGRRAGNEGLNAGDKNVDEIILERLVALNAERAEEERNGLIRWLRPDYQAPGVVQTQQVIEGIAEVETESAITPVEQQKFPKAFKDQLAAVRDLLRTQGGEWAIEQIAAQFKGASRQKQVILSCLESLEALGIVARHAEAGRWYLAELQKVS